MHAQIRERRVREIEFQSAAREEIATEQPDCTFGRRGVIVDRRDVDDRAWRMEAADRYVGDARLRGRVQAAETLDVFVV